MKIHIELDVEPGEVPLATELLNTLRQVQLVYDTPAALLEGVPKIKPCAASQHASSHKAIAFPKHNTSCTSLLFRLIATAVGQQGVTTSRPALKDPSHLLKALIAKLAVEPDDSKVVPGHGLGTD